jgi:type II secretory pathway component PulF
MNLSQIPSALDYASPDAPRPKPWISVPLVMSLGVVVAAILIPAAFITPHFEQIFHDFKTDLPLITVLLLKTSRWVVNDWGWAYLLPIPVVVPILAASVARGGTRRTGLVMVVISLVVAALVLLLTVTALFAPLIVTIQSVSSHK